MTRTVSVVSEDIVLSELPHIVIPEHVSDALADEDDNRLVEDTEAARAEFIVTGDQLVLDADPIVGAIRVVAASEFLTLLDRLGVR